MSEQFIGSHLNVQCHGNIGIFQGKLLSVSKDNGSFQLGNFLKNGKKCESPVVNISAADVVSLKIIRGPSPPPKQKATSDDRDQRESYQFDGCKNGSDGRSFIVPSIPHPTTPSRKGRRWNESTFDVPTHQLGEFDFEANLALFDKQAFKEELLNPAERVQPSTKKQTNFKHDENVIASSAPVYKEITIPEPAEKEYSTDSGLIVPSISPSLRTQLERAVEEAGIILEKRIELVARAVTELSVQLVGSHYRFDPKNRHQRPKATVLCGNHSGTSGVICCARHLAAQGFETILLLPADTRPSSCMVTELMLFSKSGGKVARHVDVLYDEEPDLIVCCLEEAIPRSPPVSDHFVTAATDWANRQRAPKLVLDPPVHKNAAVDAKATIVPYLPLAHGEERGQLYLINLSLPKDVFSSVGVSFSPPFGARFLIALHPT